MERLTKRLQSGAADYAVNMAALTLPQRSAYRQKCVEALAAYEDTGLAPEEINGLCNMDKRAKMADLLRLEEYQALGTVDELSAQVKARDEGRAVVLPTKTVFEPVWDAGDECDLKCPERFDGLDTCQGCPKAVPYAYQRDCRQDDVIGKTVFLTRAEAEAAQREEGQDG